MVEILLGFSFKIIMEKRKRVRKGVITDMANTKGLTIEPNNSSSI